MNIPVFHDDQHGTAVITLAALINGLMVVNKRPARHRIVVSGAGAWPSVVPDWPCNWVCRGKISCWLIPPA